ncbi:uncharacterized protein MKZ38_008431 [Zalerion maritima]|uniref:Mitochondrial dicarboxylate carrier n=1 Tax=Zalerion maritima TaxID=339359 RepID=A0AAD5RHJ6_9PEZI|nr:uncharacterized protein MKZ38_008431 [Zalerion maritima]
MPSPAESGAEKAAQSKVAQKSHDRVRYPFWFGGSASMKVRLQTRAPTAPTSMSGTIMSILRSSSGLSGLYNGLSASLLRQLTYSTVRFGVYEELKTRMIQKNNGASPSGLTLVGLASMSGAIGGVSGNAADIVNVRMQGDAALPPERRRNYKHAIDGMLRMTREEGGLISWFRGVGPNSVRAAIMTASQLASYDVFKKMILGWTPLGDGLTTHFSASFLAGVVAATVTSPVDVIKTRVMSASKGGSGGSSSITGLIMDITKKEGPAWVFRGWVPSFLRLGPQTICTFMFLEAHRKMYRKAISAGEYSEAEA